MYVKFGLRSGLFPDVKRLLGTSYNMRVKRNDAFNKRQKENRR